MDYSIHVEAAGDPMDPDPYEDALAALGPLVAEHHGSVTGRTTSDRVGITITVDADSIPEAVMHGERIFDNATIDAGFPAQWPTVRFEVLTQAELEAELAERPYDLVGAAEVAELLGVQRQRVTQLQTRAGFPAPVAVLRAGPVWTRASLNRFAAQWTRKPGRPAKIA